MSITAYRHTPLPSPVPVSGVPPQPVSCGFGVAAGSSANVSSGPTLLSPVQGGMEAAGTAAGAGSGPDPVKASVAHLLSRAHSVPCSAAAQAFGQLVAQPARFGVALDLLLPALADPGETPRKILAAYIMYHIYSTHPISMNPFKSAFVEVFTRERDTAASRVEVSAQGQEEADSKAGEDDKGREQLVWVLWKILKGDGVDLGPYAPGTLAVSPLPPRLRAAQLTIDEFIMLTDEDGYETIMSEARNGASNYHDGRTVSPVQPTTSPSLSRTPFGSRRASPMPPTLSEHAKNEMIEHAIRLLHEGSQRVLSLSEQRVVALALPLFSPRPMIAIPSLPSLFTLNPVLGHPLVVSLLGGGYAQDSHNVPSNGSAFNGIGMPRNPGAPLASAIGVLNVLRQLPPILPSFDILGRLLRDPTLIPVPENEMVHGINDADPFFSNSRNDLSHGLNVPNVGQSGVNGSSGGAKRKVAVSDLIRIEVLGTFVHNAMEWVHTAERQAQQGMISDDRAAKAVQSLCRFYNSLIKLGLVDAGSDTNSAAIAHFALAHAHFEDAHALYRVLVMGKF